MAKGSEIVGREPARTAERFRTFLVFGHGDTSRHECPDSEVRMPARPLIYELRNRKDTRELIDLVWLWFGSPHDGLAASNDADFRTATLDQSHVTSHPWRARPAPIAGRNLWQPADPDSAHRKAY